MIFMEVRFLLEYIYFFGNRVMDIYLSLNHDNNQDISIFQEDQSHIQLDVHPSQTNCPSLPYLKRGDSMDYISQFLNHFEEQEFDHTEEIQKIQPMAEQNVRIIEKKLIKKTNGKKQKKIKKFENSPFHNYQKHLNNALKKMIIVPSSTSQEGDFKQAANELWKKYVESQIKTKRILHFVFNERNEHSISQQQLQSYGLWQIYQRYGQDKMIKAKNYLSKLAIDQIDQHNIEGYLCTRKIKRREGLSDYIMSFKEELESGYLKRRINPQHPQ